jgi:hypothetical protein
VTRGERKAIFVHLDGEAAVILERLAPGRCKGHLLSRLLFEFEARRVAREEALAEAAGHAAQEA